MYMIIYMKWHDQCIQYLIICAFWSAGNVVVSGGFYYEATITVESGPRARIQGLSVTDNIFSEPFSQYWPQR